MEEEILSIIREIKNGQVGLIKNKLDEGGSLLLTDRLSVDGQKLLAIHYASKYGQLEIVKLLLNKKPALLDSVDEANQTAVSFAAMQGHVHVVEYLANRGANLTIAINNPYHHHYAYLPIQWAVERGHLAVVQCLISHGADIHIRLEKTQSHLIHIASAAGQLNIIQLLVDKNPALLDITDARNQTPTMLAKDKGHLHIVAYLASKNISFIQNSRYKLSGRRPSIFERLDKDTGIYTVYEPVKKIGEGKTGLVRLFKSRDGQMVAVKSLSEGPVAITSQEQLKQWHDQLKEEVSLHCNVYPDDTIQAFEFEFNHEQSILKSYDFRYVMPFYPGKTAYEIIPQITCVHRMAEIIFKIAEELQKIHHVGIVHGDIHRMNIMINSDENNITIQFFDFGLSYSMNDQFAITLPSELYGRYWYAPELCTGSQHHVKPHSNQDIFGLAYMLDKMLSSHACYGDLVQSFPSIREFICAALSENPMLRPSLSDFSKRLSDELNLFVSRNNAKTKMSLIFFQRSTEHGLSTAPSSLNKGCCTIS